MTIIFKNVDKKVTKGGYVIEYVETVFISHMWKIDIFEKYFNYLSTTFMWSSFSRKSLSYQWMHRYDEQKLV